MMTNMAEDPVHLTLITKETENLNGGRGEKIEPHKEQFLIINAFSKPKLKQNIQFNFKKAKIYTRRHQIKKF